MDIGQYTIGENRIYLASKSVIYQILNSFQVAEKAEEIVQTECPGNPPKAGLQNWTATATARAMNT